MSMKCFFLSEIGSRIRAHSSIKFFKQFIFFCIHEQPLKCFDSSASPYVLYVCGVVVSILVLSFISKDRLFIKLTMYKRFDFAPGS